VPRIRAELHYDHGVRCSRKRVFRLMRMLGIQGKRKRRKFKTTGRSLEAKPAPDLVERNFVASRPDEVWVADIKYIRSREGFLYLGGVTDVFTRTVAGWAMSASLETKLVEDALEMAILRRRPKGQVIHHSDQGTQHQPRLRAATARGQYPAFHGAAAAMPSTTPSPRASGRRSSASCSTTLSSSTEPRRDWPSSTTSRAGSTLGAVTPRWATTHRLSSSPAGDSPRNLKL
jgi:transposase InsO family protein